MIPVAASYKRSQRHRSCATQSPRGRGVHHAESATHFRAPPWRASCMSMCVTLYRVTRTEVERLIRFELSVDALLDQDVVDDSRIVELDKMWNAVHWLLTGTSMSPDGLGRILLGGSEVGDDVGYGPARLVGPDEVKQLAQKLEGLDEAVLAARWDPSAMTAAGVYPQVWDEPDVLEEEVLPSLRSVLALYRAAAQTGGL